jgi:hypothetical protein
LHNIDAAREAWRMSTSEDLQYTVEHPVPAPHHAALLASYRVLLELADEASHVQVTPRTPTSFFESWEVTRAAFMARMSGTLRHLGYLAPSESRVDGLALARTLVDHAITFAWISANPKERLSAFLRTSFKSTLAKDNRAREGGDQLLDDATRARLSSYTREVNVELPRLPRLSREADESWVDQVETSLPESMHIIDFTGLYNNIYDQYAEYDHPSTLGLQVFVHLDGSPVRAIVDGRPVRDREEDLRPYRIAQFAFAEALVVSCVASGRPRQAPLSDKLELIGTLRNLEREGRLAVTESEAGTTIGLVPDPAGD